MQIWHLSLVSDGLATTLKKVGTLCKTLMKHNAIVL